VYDSFVEDLVSANLGEANLSRANLSGANLVEADLSYANLRGADIRGADLSNANLHGADLSDAKLSGADLNGANLFETNLTRADLDRTNFSEAIFVGTIFGENDLSPVKGLDTVKHLGPSIIGVATLYEQENAIVLKGPDNDRTQILTAKEHKPPFVLRVKAKTDSKNLRLYYNAGTLIFNWEVNEDELRIHDPVTNEIIGVANQGKIEPNVYHLR
jgi:hypothetical protein